MSDSFCLNLTTLPALAMLLCQLHSSPAFMLLQPICIVPLFYIRLYWIMLHYHCLLHPVMVHSAAAAVIAAGTIKQASPAH
jgi:hypothetical protein